MTQQKPDIHRVLELQQLLLLFSQVDRVVNRKHGNDFRAETDSEHTYSLVMTSWFLARHFPDLDVNLIIQLALVHDLVETYAGDTHIFDTQEKLESKQQREQEALQKIKETWADFSELATLIEIYESCNREEAKFVYALDKIMPIMQIYINDGHTWKEEGISLHDLHINKLDKVSVSPEIKPYYDQLYQLLKASPQLIKP